MSHNSIQKFLLAISCRGVVCDALLLVAYGRLVERIESESIENLQVSPIEHSPEHRNTIAPIVGFIAPIAGDAFKARTHAWSAGRARIMWGTVTPGPQSRLWILKL